MIANVISLLQKPGVEFVLKKLFHSFWLILTKIFTVHYSEQHNMLHAGEAIGEYYIGFAPRRLKFTGISKHLNVIEGTKSYTHSSSRL